MANPYAGTDQENDWNDGFKAGLIAPDAEITAPLVLSPEALSAYEDGVAAGQLVNQALQQVPVQEGMVTDVADYEHVTMDVLGPLSALFRKGISLEAMETTIAGATGELLFNLLLLVAVWGPVRDDFFLDVVADRLKQARAAVAGGSASDNNTEFFMAVCVQPGHASTSIDPLSEFGVWHGLFRLSFEEAEQDALGHEHPTVKIYRFQTSQPTIVDVLQP